MKISLIYKNPVFLGHGIHGCLKIYSSIKLQFISFLTIKLFENSSYGSVRAPPCYYYVLSITWWHSGALSTMLYCSDQFLSNESFLNEFHQIYGFRTLHWSCLISSINLVCMTHPGLVKYPVTMLSLPTQEYKSN